MLPRDHLATINGLQLHYCEWGSADAPVVLMLHGGSAHAHWWDAFAEAVADKYRLIALDLRGHGDSAHAVPPAYRLSDYASDITVLVEQLRLERLHVVGHSLGAMIAGLLATTLTEHLSSLTLVDAQMRFTAAGARYLRRLAIFPQLVYPDRATAVRRFRVLPTQTSATRETIERMAAWAFHEDGGGRWVLKFDRASLGQLEPVDLLPAMTELQMPICLVRGEHSTVLSHERAVALQAQLGKSRLIEVADAHHHVMLDNPIAFAGGVREFLDSTRRVDT